MSIPLGAARNVPGAARMYSEYIFNAASLPLSTAMLFAILALSILFASTAWAAEDFGTVPLIEVNPDRAALGKRLFFDPKSLSHKD